MDNIILYLRHYIFINPNNIFKNIHIDPILTNIIKIHNKNYTNGEIVKYHGYKDIVNCLHNYDTELCKLFTELNHNYPALLVDIGRLIILYNYGGIYHDLKCMSNQNMIHYLQTVPYEIQLIGEEHPKEHHRVRNGNIIALHKHSPFISSILQKMKLSLKSNRNAFGPNKVSEIGSKIYIQQFLENTNKHIYKFPFQNRNMITFDNNIYLQNVKRWQTTYEYIFQKKQLSHEKNKNKNKKLIFFL